MAKLPVQFAVLNEQINESAKRQRKALAMFAKRFPQIPAVLDAWNATDNNYTGWFSHNYGGTVEFNLSQLDGFKGSDVFAAVESVEQNLGVTLECRDRPEYRQKEFHGQIKWEGGTLDVRLTCTLRMDSSLCRQVQVGTKIETVETPIFELQCANGEEALA